MILNNDNHGLKKLSKHRKTLISVSAQYKLLNKVKNMRKQNAKTAKHDSVMPHLREFDNSHPDQHISFLITTLEALDSL